MNLILIKNFVKNYVLLWVYVSSIVDLVCNNLFYVCHCMNLILIKILLKTILFCNDYYQIWEEPIMTMT